MNWIFFSVLAAMIWAAVNIVDKYILSKLVTSPVVPVIVLGFTGMVVSAFIFVLRGFEYLSLMNILLAFLAGVFSLSMAFFYFKATLLEEISRVVPLLYLTPLLVLLIAGLTLGEIFQPLTYLGVLLLVTGAVLISAKTLFSVSFGKAFWFMMLSALAMALNQVTTKYLLGFADFWTVFAYGRIGLFLFLIPAIFVNLNTLKETFREGGVTTYGVITFNELLNVGAVLSITVAATTGFITLVNALASIQAFFVLFFAVVVSIFYPWILKEETDMKTVSLKLIAIAMMFTGALLIN